MEARAGERALNRHHRSLIDAAFCILDLNAELLLIRIPYIFSDLKKTEVLFCCGRYLYRKEICVGGEFTLGERFKILKH